MKKFFLFASLALLCSSYLIVSRYKVDETKSKVIKSTVKVTDVNIEDASLKTLKDIGLVNIPTIANAEATKNRKFYKEKYGLNFISETEMDVIVKENNLLIGETENFIGNIPENAAKDISKNYAIYTAKFLELNKGSYMSPDGRIFTQEYVDELLKKNRKADANWITGKDKKGGYKIDETFSFKVNIAAPASQFRINDFEIINPKTGEIIKDPLALIRVNNGWVELARWL